MNILRVRIVRSDEPADHRSARPLGFPFHWLRLLRLDGSNIARGVSRNWLCDVCGMIDLDTTADVSAITLDLGPFSVTEVMLDSIGVELLEMLGNIEPPVVIIDLSPTHHLGSKAVSILVNAWRTTRARKGRIAFCRLNPYSREVLRTLHLDRHWEVYESRDDAVAALRASATKANADRLGTDTPGGEEA